MPCAALVREVARATYDLYLLCHVSDDIGEALVRGALEHAGVTGAAPGQVPPHRLLFCGTLAGKVSMVRQLDPELHVDAHPQTVRLELRGNSAGAAEGPLRAGLEIPGAVQQRNRWGGTCVRSCFWGCLPEVLHPLLLPAGFRPAALCEAASAGGRRERADSSSCERQRGGAGGAQRAASALASGSAGFVELSTVVGQRPGSVCSVPLLARMQSINRSAGAVRTV